ncbi:hypothetical protein SAMN04488137_1100 [Fictibacillus solisalsi]|uniref:Uncharacterized protein n=1 Tax=Fictibacillus solisalsi TaxID=459525 RepID=A0A1G9URP5_9BACL|nr:hypothetical protein [Fictibacillus solisalsi]SDM62556.1 hypothetical protein SAMN04488137_1100 [Fictibacillus solisalsi]
METGHLKIKKTPQIVCGVPYGLVTITIVKAMGEEKPEEELMGK